MIDQKDNALKSNQRLLGPHLFLLLACGFLLYLNTFLNSWSFDDLYVIVSNPDVTSIHEFIKNTYPGRPLRELSYMLDYHLFGANPFGWHFQNILLHTMNAWLVYCVAILLVNEKRVAWLASLLFLVHPIQVEVVASIGNRKDSLALFFMLVAFVCYLSFKEQKRKTLIVVAVSSLCLAVLSKQNALIFPVFMLIAEFTDRKDKIHRGASSRLVILGALSACAVGFVYMLRGHDFYVKANALLLYNNYFDGLEWTTYILAVVDSWGYMFSRFVYPFNLAVNYVRPVPESFFAPGVFLASGLVCLYLVGLFYGLRKNRFLFLAFLWIGLLYLPTSNLIPITFLSADRYLYAPSVGVFLVIAYVVNATAKSRLSWCLVVPVVVGLCWVTFEQNRVWKNNITLWEHSLRVNPESARALGNLGMLLYLDDLEKNLDMQLRAIEINPYDPFVNAKAGYVYEKRGEMDKAYEYYLKAYELFDLRVYGMYRAAYRELEEKLSEAGMLRN